MSDYLKNENLIAKITVRSKKIFIPSVISFIREMTQTEGLPVEEARKLELVTDEACQNVIKHALSEKEDDFFDILLERRPGQIVVAIEDRGLPFDWKMVDDGQGIGLGIILMKAYTDEINFINLGRDGKRMELVKNLSYKKLEDSFLAEEKKSGIPEKISISDRHFTVRLMKPEEGISLARCFYRAYEYSYEDYVYFPEKMKEILEKELQKSMVAITKGNEIAGHVAIIRENEDHRIAKITQVVVDPLFYEEEVFQNIIEKCLEYGKENSLTGLTYEASLSSIYTQNTILKFDGTETGFLLSSIDKEKNYMQNRESEKFRQSSALYYINIKEEEEQIVYPPFNHTSIIEKIYEKSNLKRKFKKSLRSVLLNSPEKARVDVKIMPDRKMAFIKISEYGQDIKDLVRVSLKELCLNKMDCIYIDLPLSHPATANVSYSLEFLGLFLAGVLPFPSGDILRMQYLNNVKIETKRVNIQSNFGKELFDYIVKSKEEAGVQNLI